MTTAKQMSKMSWEARKKKYGEKGALEILAKASKKGVKAKRLKAKCQCDENNNPS